jgi:hypothetical protein
MGVKLFRNNIYKGIKAENPIYLHHNWKFIKVCEAEPIGVLPGNE